MQKLLSTNVNGIIIKCKCNLIASTNAKAIINKCKSYYQQMQQLLATNANVIIKKKAKAIMNKYRIYYTSCLLNGLCLRKSTTVVSKWSSFRVYIYLLIQFVPIRDSHVLTPFLKLVTK